LQVRLTRRTGAAALAAVLVVAALAGVALSRSRTGTAPGQPAAAATTDPGTDTVPGATASTAAATTAPPTTGATTTARRRAAGAPTAGRAAAAPRCPARPAGAVSRTTGTVTERVNDAHPPDDHTFDLRGMTSIAYGSSTVYALTFGISGKDSTAGGLCILGGTVRSAVSRARTWDDLNGDVNGDALSFGTRSGVGIVDGLRADNTFDGITTHGDPPAQTVVRDVWLTGIRDDCIENDSHPKTLTVRDSLFDGCFTGISERPGSGDGWSRPSGAGGVTTLDHVLLRLAPQAYGTGCRYERACTDGRGHHVFFKWSGAATPSVVIRDSVLRMDRYSIDGPTPMRFPPGTRAERSVLVWLGPGPYPQPLPPGMTLTRDVRVWERARAGWLCRHRQGPC